MNNSSAAALRKLADSLPPCDALNLGYALLVEGELPPSALERAVQEVVSADPLMSQWRWHAGAAGCDEFAALAAEHLSTPLEPACPFSAALWSGEGSTHLFLLAAHHLVADGVVLDRIGVDLSRRLRGEPIQPVLAAEQRSLPASPGFAAARLPLPPAGPSVRASCRVAFLPAGLTQRFRELTRGWRTTPFAGAVACAAAVVAAWTGEKEVGVSIQVSGRNSNRAQRAPGPWYDHSRVRINVPPGEPLRALLLEVSQTLVQGLATSGIWAGGTEDEPLPELLVVYDQHPLSRLKIPGCQVRPQSVRRHPLRPDGMVEHLVATEADVVVYFREQCGSIGFSLFTKTLRVPEPTAEWLFQAVLDTLRALCEEGQNALDMPDFTPAGCIEAPPSPAWPEPALSDLPLVDAVSPVFRVRPDTLAAFGRDALHTLNEWGPPPWQ